ncbi:hypothetical protein FGIG_09666 [Fasciola gigantica]|uniref:Major facilitator superfamily (MFS) profile domain-containing protein n=1 Tax=Fasciola gigantica TaxID=46835 RepID=A0A504YKV5_FASGI|nr:hypothetical protein FGIG_09666 [Fasciola gigantica]
MLSFVRDVTVLLLATALVGFSMEFMVPVSYQSPIGLRGNICFRVAFLGAAVISARVWTTTPRLKTHVFSMQLGCLFTFTGYMFLWTSSTNLSTYWSSFSLFIIGLLFIGLASPFLFCSAAIHLYESAPEAWRGTFGCLPWLMITVAATLVQITITRFPWGLWISVCSSLAFIANLFLSQISEPDRQLMQKTDLSDVQPLIESSDTENSTKSDSNANPSEVRFLVADQTDFCCFSQTRFQTLIWLMLMHQVTGASAVMYLAELMLEFAPKLWPVDYAVAIGLPQIIGVFLACLFANRVPSVYLLRFSSVVMTGTSFALGYLLKQPQMKPINSCLITCIAFGLLAYAIGWGPIPWLLVNQMHSTADRRWAMGTAFFVSSIALLIVHVTFELLITVLGIGNYFWIVALICLCSTLHFRMPHFTNRGSVKILPRPSLKLSLHPVGQALRVDPESRVHLLNRKRFLLGPRLKVV